MRKTSTNEFSIVVEHDASAGPLDPSTAKLKRLADLKAQIERLQSRLAALAGNAPKASVRPKKKHLNRLHPDIRRLTGLAPTDWEAEAIYHEHLVGRHA